MTVTPRTPRTPRLRADAARNRSRILVAARELVTAEGPDAGMDEIAARAGVAVGTLYRHFPTKTDLVRAVMGEVAETITSDLDAAAHRIRAGADAFTELTGLLRRLAVDWAPDRALRAAASDLGAHAGDTLERAALAALDQMVCAAVDAGTVRADVTVDDVALLMRTAPTGTMPSEQRRRWAELVARGLAG